MRQPQFLALLGHIVLSEALSVGGGLSILSKNNLDQNPLPGSAAILVHEASNYGAADEQCAQLSEALWSYDAEAFAAGVGSALAHQVFLGDYDADALFWIAGEEESCGCAAVTVDGQVKHVPCRTSLPALCTQSAPVSWPGRYDTSEEFQITQEIGDLSLTGYRDFFVWKFLGVRYAPEPVRFEYSEPLRGASGNISALEHGSACLQLPVEVPDGGSDDCLFANIWTPYLPPAGGSPKAALRPVQVFFHGGGLTSGTANNIHTDGGNFASRADVVVIAVNYRLGNAGMIVFNDGIHNGNVAIGDQISALQWIAENIASFGGDPDRVTISGESGGAMASRYLMTTPLAQGLFKQAILRSDGGAGMLHGYGHFLSIQESYERYTTGLLGDAECEDAEDPVACLRELDGQTLAMLNPMALYPVVDGTILTVPHLPVNGTQPGYARDIRVMSGVTAEEGGIYVHFIPPLLGIPHWGVITSLEELALMASYLGTDITPMIENYDLFGLDPISPTRVQIENALESYLTLSSFHCFDMATMYSTALHGAFETVYGFQFNRTYSGPDYTSERCNATRTDEFPDGDPSVPYWRCHGGEQLPTWGNIVRSGQPDRDGLDVTFSQLAVDSFAAFIYTGDPNPDQDHLAARGYDSTLQLIREMGDWTPVDPVSPEWMVLSMDGGMEAFPDAQMCDIIGQPLDYWEV